MVQWFKTMTANAYMRGVRDHHWPPFAGRLWQHNCYDHIVRNDAGVDRIRDDIVTNPLRWELDQPHLDNLSRW
jgi:REP element-mobilizing transposase RayT